jgi:hypothetical protein
MLLFTLVLTNANDKFADAKEPLPAIPDLLGERKEGSGTEKDGRRCCIALQFTLATSFPIAEFKTNMEIVRIKCLVGWMDKDWILVGYLYLHA